jgi:hypothetical protein
MKLICLALIFLLLACTSCEKESEESFRFNLGVEQEFFPEKEYISDNRALRFSIIEIRDGRCPLDVYCFWQGMVQVKIAIGPPAKDTILLNSHNMKITQSGNYEFELIDVTPYPDINNQASEDDYRVFMKVAYLP